MGKKQIELMMQLIMMMLIPAGINSFNVGRAQERDYGLEILSTQQLSGNTVEAAVRYSYEPGYDAMIVVTMNCNTRKINGQTALSPSVVKLIASRVCK
jgi:hypothetical protein